MRVRILIVDDNTTVVKKLTNTLSGQGYEVESCGDNDSGWERLVAAVERKAPMPDLLLLSLNTPSIDGISLLRHIRADERFDLLPIITLTAEADANMQLTVLEEGANDYLSKPIQTLELLARVKTLTGWKVAERIQQRRMERLIEAGRILLSTHDLDVVLARVMEIVKVETDTEDASIWLRNPDGGLECRAAFGVAAEQLVGMQMGPGEGVAGWVLEHKQSALVPDAQADPRFCAKVNEEIQFRTYDLITVPLLVRGRGTGVLQAVNKKRGTFSPTDLAWMEVLAPLAAAAIESAQLFQELHQRTIQLQQRTDQLQTHNEELDAFAHTVAHDLKAPVTSIFGFSTMLEDTYGQISEKELRDYLHTIAQGAHRMSRIVDELLLLAGVRKQEVESVPLDMADIVAETLERLESIIKEGEAVIVLPETWPTALSYGPWIKKVWANYISNAIKYGGQPPHIEMGATEQADGSIRFWVHDNGTGLTAEAQAQLFVPFTRLDQLRVEGHGLGLSIVRRIMEKLGGQVGVESQVGQGSIFFFALPGAHQE